MNEHIPTVDRHPYVILRGRQVLLRNTHPDDPSNNRVFGPKECGMVNRNHYDLSAYAFSGWNDAIKDLPEVTHKKHFGVEE